MCYVLLGGTAAASKENFMTWIDNIIIAHGGRIALVTCVDGTLRRGLYQSLTLAQFLRIESELSVNRVWIHQALNANLSAGRYFSIGGSGKGSCTITNTNLGLRSSTSSSAS